MKEMMKPTTISQNIRVFVSDDGTEFEYLEQCIAYERKQQLKEIEQIEQCPEAEYQPNFNGSENMEFHEYKWFRPKNSNEIELLNLYAGENACIDDTSIGKWVCVEIGEAVWISTLDEGIEYVKTLLGNLGFDITISEKRKADSDDADR